MEAVCPQCQIRYEVPEELLQPGTPVLCPSCQVGLIMVQPGTNIPLEESRLAAQQTVAGSSAGRGPESEPPAAPRMPSDAGATLDAEPVGTPSPGPPASPTAGAQPAAEQAQRSELITEPEGPRDNWDSGALLWGGTAGLAAGQASEPPSDEQLGRPPQASAPERPDDGVWGVGPTRGPADAGHPVDRRLPTAETGDQPPDVASEFGSGQTVSGPEALPMPEPVAQRVPEPTAQPVPEPATQVSPGPPATLGTGSQPAADSGEAIDDWAAAAARWAASGFSPDSMPDFVKGREEDKTGAATELQPSATAAASAAAGDLGARPAGPAEQPGLDQRVAAPPGVAEEQADQPAMVPAVQPALPPEALESLAAGQRPPTPPPLPAEERPDIQLPRPSTPPPLQSRSSSYVLRGSGEGTQEEMPPWFQDPDAPASGLDESPSGSFLAQALPVGLAEDLQAARSPEPEAARSSSALGVVLLCLFGLALAAAGGYGGYYLLNRLSADAIEEPAVLPRAHRRLSTGEQQSADASVAAERDPSSGASEAETDASEPVAERSRSSRTARGDRPRKGPAVGDKGKGPVGKRSADAKTAASRKSLKRSRQQAMQHYRQGNEAIRNQQFKEAVNLFRRALRADKSLALAHRGLGISYAQLRQNKKACREYRKYLELLPPDSKEVPALKKILEGCK